MAIKRSTKLDPIENEAILNLQKRRSLIDEECAEIKKTELSIDNRIEVVKTFITKTDEIEKNLVIALQKKYGKGTFDSAKGLFVPL
jgi:hypothetical protein|tara:strand:- start:271 stop:528 length:258 start_codon:yes stop_codon:yes gene_type:complete